ncbi:MAG: CHAT domain-containing protein [Azonexus sp.]|nr:CHAT domain-containing protein [Azonexus sp.]
MTGLLMLNLLPLAVAQDVAETLEVLPAQGTLLAELERQVAAPPPDGSDLQKLCIYRHQRGMANNRLGRTADAIADLRLALELNQPNRLSPNQWCERWRIQVDLANSYRQAGDPLARVEFVKQLGEEVRKTNIRRYFFTLTWLMDDYVTLGMLKSAENVLRKAGELIPELRQRRDWVREEANILNQWNLHQAYMQELRGNFAEAERLRRESLRLARVYFDLRTSIDAADSQILRGARSNVAVAQRLLAKNLSEQGKFSEAEVYSRQGLSLLLTYTARTSPEVARALGNLGVIKLQQGRLDVAEDLFLQSLAAMEGSQARSSSPLLAESRAKLAFALQMQERWAASLALFEARDQGLRSNQLQFDRTGSFRSDWAYALIRMGKVDQAVEMMQRIVAYNQRIPYVDPQILARAKGFLATALAAKGDDRQALAVFEDALPALLKMVASDAEGDGLGAARQFRINNILEAYLGLLARLHARGELANGRDPVAEAFAIADVARGSAVQRAVIASSARASLPDPALAELARKEQDAGNRKLSLSRILARLASASEGQRLDSVMADLRREIDQLGKQQEELRAEISSRFPEYLSLIDPKPVVPGDLQAALKPDEAVVAIYSARDQAYVWTISPQKVSYRVVPLARSQLNSDVARIRASLDIGDAGVLPFDGATAHSLYKSLLAPDEALWSSSKLLNLIPHGSLGQIPLGILPTAPYQSKAGNAKAAWLIRKVAIVQQSSASSFLALRQRAASSEGRESFVGFGDPLFSREVSNTGAAKVRKLRLMVRTEAVAQEAEPADRQAQAFARLSPLPDTLIELEDIARTLKADPERDLYLGSRATERNVKNGRLAGYRIVAFATHGLVPGELLGLDQPALALSNPVLSNDKENDGLLTLEEILGLRLNADWVVLSACNTGSGDGLQGEAVSGLGRGFFFAGARSLLVSNWAVETVSARLLTTGLFRTQLEEPGLTRAEALRRSMLLIMQSPEPNYSHPAYWGPFTLVGDGYR